MSSNSEAMLGATRAAVLRPDESSNFTSSLESRNSIAAGEQAIKHNPHPMHLCGTIVGCAFYAIISIALTGQTLPHE